MVALQFGQAQKAQRQGMRWQIFLLVRLFDGEVH
jgi:hypothetical protein